ncbi:MAG TPA: mandelate racemase/muconate lactonizing enzyme family protein [Candidatus Bathyarchaeia archaeon]|nr:mandelate racemase/muconate lactonizing enzyme family protein [Candidatus Bathyarchaeia archaeon]
MKIKTVERIPIIYHILKKGWGDEKETRSKKYEIWPSTMPSVLVKITTSDGLTGIGEAMAMDWYLGNSQAHNYTLIGRYAKQLENEDPVNLERIHKILIATSGRGHPTARSADDAIDMALLDLLGQAWGEPVYNVLGGFHHKKIPLNPNLYLGTPEQMAEEAKRFVSNGYKALKIKCGMDIEQDGWSMDSVRHDIAKLTRTLEEVPENVLIDADSNQSWGNYKRAISIVQRYDLERHLNLGIEQPVHYLDIEGASKIARTIKLQLILDESVFSPEALANVIRRNAADRIVLKTSRVGGIYVARKMISMAETFGINVAIDGLPYSRIGDTAMCHLAATIREPYPGGFDGHTWFRENPVKTGGLVIEEGYAKVPTSPGLGIQLDDNAIEEMRVQIDL